MLVRNAAEAMSAAPPITSISTATTSIGSRQSSAKATATPNPNIARPQTITAASTATPWRAIRETQPENTPPSTAPIGMPANSSANAMPPLSGPPKFDVRDLGEQRPRHPEDHRDDVDEERHQQHRLAREVAEPVDAPP